MGGCPETLCQPQDAKQISHSQEAPQANADTDIGG